MGNSQHQQENHRSSMKSDTHDEYLQSISQQENHYLVQKYQELQKTHKIPHQDIKNDGNQDIHHKPDTESLDVHDDVFHSRNYKNFSHILIRRGVYRDVKTFRKHIVLFTHMSSTFLETIWNILEPVEQHSEFKHASIRAFLILCYDFSFENQRNISEFTETIDKIIQFIIATRENQMIISTDSLNFDDFVGWIQNFAPFAPKIFETFFHRICWKDDISPAFTPFQCPILLDNSSSIVNEIDLLPLAMYSDRLQGQWIRLYTSESDGLSFNRVAHHIIGYEGPTCMLIKVRGPQKVIIGAYSDDRWKESNKFYGSFRDFVFSLHPNLKICRSRNDGNSAYRWLNTKSYSQPHGLGFGGTTEQFRLFIPESLEVCTARPTCLTYEPGKLLPYNALGDDSFEIDVFEIWGTGGMATVMSGLQSRDQHRGTAQDVINKARKVDKAAFFNNSFDQEYLLSNTLQHRGHVTDRTGS